MSVNTLERVTGPQSVTQPSADKTAVKVKDSASFTSAMQSSAPVADSGAGETTTADLLAEARRNLLLSTGRHMQEAAKDIERENLDKGF
ncbi:hypothetical protein LJC09_01190 [Desulfovibrio sp. OttesenSCG-928-F20]|nr:hypothetical protein [Desulfovibrio sp. OttesenSCG-928-F20]